MTTSSLLSARLTAEYSVARASFSSRACRNASRDTPSSVTETVCTRRRDSRVSAAADAIRDVK